MMAMPPERLAALPGSDHPDALVLLQMAQIGTDLRKPHAPEFVFEVVGEAPLVQALVKELAALDYSVKIYSPDQKNPIYQVVARKTMVLELAALMGISRQFEALADRYCAVYDGWGAEIVE